MKTIGHFILDGGWPAFWSIFDLPIIGITIYVIAAIVAEGISG